MVKKKKTSTKLKNLKTLHVHTRRGSKRGRSRVYFTVFRQSLVLVRREASLVGHTLTLSAQSPEQGHCVEEGRQGTVQRSLSSLFDGACVHKPRNDFWKRWWKSHAAAALEADRSGNSRRSVSNSCSPCVTHVVVEL